jgi:hypothetical protein
LRGSSSTITDSHAYPSQILPWRTTSYPPPINGCRQRRSHSRPSH